MCAVAHPRSGWSELMSGLTKCEADRILVGDCLTVLKTLPGESVRACDEPALLGTAGQVPRGLGPRRASTHTWRRWTSSGPGAALDVWRLGGFLETHRAATGRTRPGKWLPASDAGEQRPGARGWHSLRPRSRQTPLGPTSCWQSRVLRRHRGSRSALATASGAIGEAHLRSRWFEAGTAKGELELQEQSVLAWRSRSNSAQSCRDRVRDGRVAKAPRSIDHELEELARRRIPATLRMRVPGGTELHQPDGPHARGVSSTRGTATFVGVPTGSQSAASNAGRCPRTTTMGRTSDDGRLPAPLSEMEGRAVEDCVAASKAGSKSAGRNSHGSMVAVAAT